MDRVEIKYNGEKEQARFYEHQLSSTLNALSELKVKKLKKPIAEIKRLLKDIEKNLK